MKFLKFNILFISALITLIATLIISICISCGRFDDGKSIKAENKGKAMDKVQADPMPI